MTTLYYFFLKGYFNTTNFIPIYLADNEPWMPRLIKEILDLLTGTESHIITTRIDNDDSLHINMVDLIQQQLNGQEDLYVNYNNGLQYDMDNQVLCRYEFRDNPFLSRIEKINENTYKTVWERKHNAYHAPGTIKYIKSQPIWLQIIHSGNLLNNLRMDKLILSDAITNDFNMKYPLKISKRMSLILLIKYFVSKILKKARKIFN